MCSSTSGSTGGFRQTDPCLRKWQSLSHLPPEGPTRSFSPSPGAELRASRGASFRQAEVGQWLQDSHERVDTQLDRLTTRNSQLNYNRTAARLLDMKHKVSWNISKSAWKHISNISPLFAFCSVLATDCLGGFIVVLLWVGVLFVFQWYWASCYLGVFHRGCQKWWPLLSRRRGQLNYPSLKRAGSVEIFKKSECSKRKCKGRFSWMTSAKIEIPHVEFTHKGPTAGEGAAANEVHFGQRERKISWLTWQSITNESRRLKQTGV